MLYKTAQKITSCTSCTRQHRRYADILYIVRVQDSTEDNSLLYILYKTAQEIRRLPVHPVQDSTKDTQTFCTLYVYKTAQKITPSCTSCTRQHRRYADFLYILYMTVQKIRRHAFLPQVGFEPTIPVFVQLKTVCIHVASISTRQIEEL
jgi:hypothetical protein